MNNLPAPWNFEKSELSTRPVKEPGDELRLRITNSLRTVLTVHNKDYKYSCTDYSSGARVETLVTRPKR